MACALRTVFGFKLQFRTLLFSLALCFLLETSIVASNESSVSSSFILPASENILANKSENLRAAGTEKKPVVCKYLITFKYTCKVPKQCDAADQMESCTDVVKGSWTDDDDIVHWYDVCVFTDHFSTCTFLSDGTYECKMVWEQRLNPNGTYTGDAATGFKRVATPLPRQMSDRRAGKGKRKDRNNFRPRIRRSGGGTC